MNKLFFTFALIIIILFGCSDDDKPLQADLNRNPENFSVTVSTVTTSSAMLQWDVAADPDNDTVTYSIFLEGTELEANISATEYSLESLLPNTTYNGSVIASDNEGGSASAQFSFTTQQTPSSEISGEVLWQKSYGGSDDDDAYTISSLPDGGYIVGGSSESIDGDINNPIGGIDSWILKLNSEGEIEWQTTIGGTGHDTIHDIKPTSDGGYIVGAFSTSNDNDVMINNGMRDFWIVKLSASGAIEWSTSLGGSSDDILESIIQTSDGDYVAVGHTLSDDLSSGKADIWVVKLNSTGGVVWDSVFGQDENDTALSIYETNDSGYILGGFSTTLDNKRDAWLIKIDYNGDLEWEKLFGGSENDEFVTIMQTLDNGYLLSGYTRSEIPDNIQNGAADAWIVKTDEDGNLLWQKTIGGSDSEVIIDAVEIPGEGFAFTGSSRMPDGFTGLSNGASDFLVFKTDLNGGIIWQRSLGDQGDDYGASITITGDLDLVVAGSLYTNIVDQGEGSTGDHNFWVLKLKN